MKHILTIDVGTTSIKVSILNDRFQILACETIEYLLITKGDTVELDAGIYLNAVENGIKKLDRRLGLDHVAGISVTTQGETLIPVDRQGTPLTNAVVWLDGRAEREAEKIREMISEEEFYRTTGVPECNGFCPVSKILWFREQLYEVYENTRYFLLLEDFIIHYLTGRFVTEKSLLATTGYFNLSTDELWTDVLAKCGIDAAKIPEALDCGVAVGSILPELAERLNLPKCVKVVTGAMDQVCNAIGAGNIRAGVITEVTGTALCIGTTIHKAEIHAAYQVPIYRHFSKELQLMIPVCMTAGMSLKWFKDMFCTQEEEWAQENDQSVYVLLDQLAEMSPPLSNGVTMIPYFSGSLQPVRAPKLRASFNGIGLNCTKADFVRSILEGVGYMLLENVMILEELSKNTADQVITMGGGSKSRLWNSIKASILGKPVIAYAESETASIGAAILCSVGLKLYKSVPEACGHVALEKKEFLPDVGHSEKYRQGFAVYRKILEGNTK